MLQRELNYRACIHFYILFDLDLNEHHLRFYAQIEQMESHPNPSCRPTFSYQWIAKQLGIKRRYAIEIANKLKEKGYVERIPSGRDKNNQVIYLWRTTKTAVGEVPTLPHLENRDTVVQSECTPLVQSECTPLVQSECTLNTSKINTSKNKTKNPASEACTPSDEGSNVSVVDPTFEYPDTLYPPSPAKQKRQTPVTGERSRGKTLSLQDLKQQNPFNIPDQMLEDWRTMRRHKKATITQTVWSKLLRELERCRELKIDPLQAFEEIVVRAWSGFNADWLLRSESKNGKGGKSSITDSDLDSLDWIHNKGIYL